VLLPLACFGCRCRVALIFARVLLLFPSLYVCVARVMLVHVVVHGVVLRGCAWMVVMFEPMSKSSQVPYHPESAFPCPINTGYSCFPYILSPLGSFVAASTASKPRWSSVYQLLHRRIHNCLPAMSDLRRTIRNRSQRLLAGKPLSFPSKLS
jgi:hypothetical protein